MSELSAEFGRVAEASNQQSNLLDALMPILAAIDTDSKREATAVMLEAIAGQINTPEGLAAFQAEIAEHKQSNK